MSAARQDFEMMAGRDKTIYFALTNGGPPLDLTGATLRWRCVQQIDAGTSLVEKTTASGGGITITDATGGLCSVALTDTDIAESGLYYHFLDINGSGGYELLSRGRIVVVPGAGGLA